MSNKNETTLLKDKHWGGLDGVLCRVTNFTPLLGTQVKNGKAISTNKSAPYASVIIECTKLSKDLEVTGYITHEMDFTNLWSAFKERGINDSTEEVLVYWTKKHYSNIFSKFLSSSMPKLIVMICPKGTYESCPDGFEWAENERSMVLVHGLGSIKWWKPDVIK
mgnify:FL=1